MSSKLYQLSEKYQQLEAIIEQGISLTPADVLQDMLVGIQEDFEAKVGNIAKLVLSLQADNVAVQSEIARLGNRMNSNTATITWLKSYLLSEMEKVKILKVKSDVATVAVRNNPPSCAILNEGEVPPKYFRTVPEIVEVDKRAILEAFKKTGEIPGGVSIITTNKHVEIK